MLGMVLMGAVLALGAPSASSAAAAPDLPKPAAAAKGAPDDPNRVICHSANLPGSRLVNRTCMTAAAWRERQLQDQRDLNYSQKGPQVMTR